MQALQSELTDESMFVFDYGGKAYELPIDATALDFAYHKYGENANKAWRVKINSLIQRVKTPLKAGDIVEVLFSNVPQIEPGWRGFTKTPKAQTIIAAFLKKFREKIRTEFSNFELIIEKKKRPDILGQILREISSQNADICGTISNELVSGREDLYFNFKKADLKKIKRAAIKIRKIDGVIDVTIQ
jgi:(p)ppGpp synthase/HD superfamily hydrolase